MGPGTRCLRHDRNPSNAGEEVGSFIENAADTAPSLEDELIAADEIRHTRETVLPLLAQLFHREREIVQRTAMGNETLEPVAADLGISRERVRQIRERALAKLRTAITGETKKPPPVTEGFVPPEIEAATPEVMATLSSAQRRVIETMYGPRPPLGITATARALAQPYSTIRDLRNDALAKLGATPPRLRGGPPPKPRPPSPKRPRVAKANRAPAPPPPAPTETFTPEQLAALPAFARRLVEARMATPPVPFFTLDKELGISAAEYHYQMAMRVLRGGPPPHRWRSAPHTSVAARD
jgi:DNA-binding CsgD family transcriptional regulator